MPLWWLAGTVENPESITRDLYLEVKCVGSKRQSSDCRVFVRFDHQHYSRGVNPAPWIFGLGSAPVPVSHLRCGSGRATFGGSALQCIQQAAR